MYPLKSNKEDGHRVTWYINEKYGPIFGGGADLWIKDKCNVDQQPGSGSRINSNSSFELDPAELSGAKGSYNYFFNVTDYEVFSITLES